jgi:hypothetical protein
MAGGAKNHRRIQRTRALVGRRKDPVEETTSQKLATARVSVDNADAFIDVSAVSPPAARDESLTQKGAPV